MTAPPSDNVFIGDLPGHITQQDCESIFTGYGTIVQCRVMEPKSAGGKASALVRFGSVEEATWVVENLNGNLAEGLEEPIVVRFANPPGSKGKDGGKGWSDNGWKGSGKTQRAEPYGGKGAQAASWGAPNFAQMAQKGYNGKGGINLGGGGKGGKGTTTSARALLGAAKGAGLLGGGQVPIECQVYVNNLPRDTADVDLYKLFSPFGAISPSGVKAMIHDDGACKGFGFVDFMDPLSAQAAIESLNGFALADGVALGVSQKVAGKGKGQ